IETSSGAGPAIFTGALTTAVAFFAAALTSFKGVSELGLIAGGGILLCAIAELTMLPAAIYLIDRSGWGARLPEPLAVHKWIVPFTRLPRLSLALTFVVTAVLCGGLGSLWYDHK